MSAPTPEAMDRASAKWAKEKEEWVKCEELAGPCGLCSLCQTKYDLREASLHDVETKIDVTATPVAAFYVTQCCGCHGAMVLLYKEDNVFGLDHFDRMGKIGVGRKTATFFSTAKADVRMPSYLRAFKMSAKKKYNLHDGCDASFGYPCQCVQGHIDLADVEAQQLQGTIASTIQKKLHRQGYDCGEAICWKFAHDLMVEIGKLPSTKAGGYFATDEKFQPVSELKLRCTFCNCICGHSQPLGAYLSAHGYGDARQSLAEQERASRK